MIEPEKLSNEEYQEYLKIARFVYNKYFRNSNALKDDLISFAVYSLWKYSKKYDSSKSKRITFLSLICKRAMLCFLRDNNKKNNSLTVSLSAPIGDNEDCLFADFIADEKNNLDTNLNIELLKKLVFETLEDMKEYSSTGQLKNARLFEVVPLYLKLQNFQAVANKIGVTKQYVFSLFEQFKKRFKKKLEEVGYFG